MTLYLASYSAIARNVSTTSLASALAAIPRDVATETLLGLVSLADVTTSAPPFVTRAMSYTSAPGAMIPNPQLGAFLSNYYTATFREALSTPIVAAPVATVATSLAPVLWVRADVAPGPLVDSWPDLSGHANNPSQAAPGNQPGRVVSAGVSQYVLRFAAAQVLDTAHPLAFDEFTYFATFQSAGPAGLLFERGPNATTTSGENLFTSQPSSIAIRRAGVTHTGNAPVGWGTDGAWHVAAYEYSNANGGILLVDSKTLATTTALAAEAVSAILHVGARTGPAVAYTGDLRELFAFPGLLDAASVAAVSGYLGAQVGL